MLTLLFLKTERTQVGGDLIAIKQTSLLLLQRDAGVDVTVDIEDFSEISIVKKIKALGWGGIGLLIGRGGGALVITLPTPYFGWDIARDLELR